MKKKSVARIIAGSFFKTLGALILLVAAGVLSYYLTMLYYRQTARTERSTAYTHVITVNTGNESSNLIYSYDETTGKIQAMVLELFDATTKNMNYITIPADTRISISPSTYAELIKVSGQLPQLASMADINSYFSGDVAYEYGILILQEEFPVDIGYFTALPSDKFDEYFQIRSKSEKIYAPSDSLLDRAAACRSEREMKDLIGDIWDDLVSDTTLSQKSHYADALRQVNREYIRTDSVYGSQADGYFALDSKKSRKLVNNIWESQAYTSPQKASRGALANREGASASADRRIQITNATGINGLASAYQQKLLADGFNVVGVGNYIGEKRTQTVIYVKKKKWGKNLTSYFKNARREKASSALTNGADIEIVLGTDDAL